MRFCSTRVSQTMTQMFGYNIRRSGLQKVAQMTQKIAQKLTDFIRVTKNVQTHCKNCPNVIFFAQTVAQCPVG